MAVALALSLLPAGATAAGSTPATGIPAATTPAAAPGSPADAADRHKGKRSGSRGRAIDKTWFGIHSYQSQPEVPAGTLRLACAPTWREIQPARGEWDWSKLDLLVQRANEWGYRDILFSFCAAPRWAAPDIWGSPKRLSDWTRFVRAIANRYSGQIRHWEVWNEVTSRFFYEGTPQRMAKMTAIAYRVIHKVNPRATVVSASVQTHQPAWLRRFFPAYLDALAKMKWPVDVIGLHTYTLSDPLKRAQEVQDALDYLERRDPPRRLRIWDTEVNTQNKQSRTRQAALVARTFLDSWRLGIERTYWFLWTSDYYDFLGIQMRTGDPATAAYQTLGRWTAAARLTRCRDQRRLITCDFRSPRGRFTIAYAERGKVRYEFSGVRKSCSLTSEKCKRVRRSAKVGITPVRFT